jgi:hypothetical protein
MASKNALPPSPPAPPTIEHRLVRVSWEGPFSVDEVRQGGLADMKGLYQVYGQHVVFGPGSLLYVGMTDRQTYKSRFKQHYDRWLQYESDVHVRLGLVDDEAIGLLASVEALTIWWHSPPYNSKNIWLYKGDPLRVQNWKNRGRLHAEYSSHWKPREPPEGES